MPQILIVEDDPAIAATLKFSLEREGHQVVWVDMVSKVAPTLADLPSLDAMILDIGLPDGDGFGVCQMVRSGRHHQHVPIVFLTAKDDEIDIVVALEMGADDYITKPFSPRELIARIKAIWRRQALSPQDNTAMSGDFDKDAFGKNTFDKSTFEKDTKVGKWQYRQSDYTLSLDGNALTLSKTELAIMLSFLDNPNHVLTREQILSRISDHPEHRLVRTIDSHIKTLRQKLCTVSDKDIILTHRGLGYSLC